ncbi:MAG: diguanylate cyclase [Fibromonadales bacterium]|nr:diguanylate cyclase [Fibromonadales bacterium]
MIVEVKKRGINKSLTVFLSMIVILTCIILFTGFLILNFRTFLSEQTRESVYLEKSTLLSELSLYLKKIEYSLLESKLVSSYLIETSTPKELSDSYMNSKIKLNSDIHKIHVSPNNDSIRSHWFLTAKKANGRIAFTTPYYDSSSNKTLIDFSTNVYNNKGYDIGVVAHSLYLDRLAREVQKHQKSPEHQIYLLDYSKNLIISTGHKIDEADLSKYWDKIFSYSILFTIDNGFYIFFTPIFEKNFVLISKMPIRSFYATTNFFFNKSFIIPAAIFIAVIILVSIFVIWLMGREQRKKERIEVESLTDPLTKVFNRRYFDNIIESKFIKMKAAQKPISLLMADIDLFKQCNDTYGHSAGDKVLSNVANVLMKYARREDDFVTRLGGEEFGILLIGTHKEDAIIIAENIRKDVWKTETQIDGISTPLSVTVSIGVASLIPQKEHSFHMLYETADKLLYKAKESGRNQVCY